MNDTKEKILTTALRLFAQDGYEAVSVSMIAGELGITKGALYRHYKSKRDIFDCIVARMIEQDVALAAEHKVPEETFEQSPEAYRQRSMVQIRNFTLAQFRFWTEDEFGRDFRKMVTLEQYRNSEMAEWHEKVLTNGPVEFLEDLFREMTGQGILKNRDSRQLALDFYAPFYLLIAVSDTPAGRESAAGLLSAHIENFIQNNTH